MEVVHIVGAGGIGCALGYALRRAGLQVQFVETNSAKIAQGQSHGVTVDGHPPMRAEFVHFDQWSPPAGSLILLCTKCYDNRAVISQLPDSPRLVPVQNGVDPQLDGLNHPVEGIASFVSECAINKPAIRITRAGVLHIGGRGRNVPAWLRDLATALRGARLFKVFEVSDVRPYKHAKLMYNAAISPLAAAAGLDNGQLLSNVRARMIFFDLLKENYAILAGAGVPLGRVGPFCPTTVNRILAKPWLARMLGWAFEPGLRGTYCSMFGDLPRGQTEIANYNGWLVALAGERPCPLNRRAVNVIGRMEQEGIKPHIGALAWFEGS